MSRPAVTPKKSLIYKQTGCRTKQTKDKLYKQVDGIWTEAETTTKKVRLKMLFQDNVSGSPIMFFTFL